MSDGKFGSWSVAESPVAVEYSLVVIEEIRHEVAEGFQRLSRGGIEVGGILYGTRDGRTVNILAMRPIRCEHAHGPGFQLSPSDKEVLREQLEHELEDPRLEGMICVGWFLSHTRGDITLTDSDLDIYAEFFGAVWHVALVVRPGRGGVMRAGFFVREGDGSVQSDHSYLEFNFPDRLAGVLDRPPRPPRMPGERRNMQPRATLGSGGGPAPAPPFLTVPAPADLPPVDAPDFLPQRAPKSRWPWIVASILALIAIAVGGFRYFMPLARLDPIGLTVAESNGQLQIQWNHLSRTLNGAAQAKLTIIDGGQTHVEPLSTAELERGNFSYARTSGDVEVHLSVVRPSGETAEEISRFLGRPPADANADQLKDLQQQRDALQAQVQKLRQQNADQAERLQQLDRTLRIMQARPGAK